MPGYAERCGEIEDGVEVIGEKGGCWCNFGERHGRGAKENNHPPIGPWDDTCVFPQFNTCIRDGSLDASGSSKTFNSNMLNIDVVVPHHRKIGLVGGSNGGITVSFSNIERGSLCSRLTVRDLRRIG